MGWARDFRYRGDFRAAASFAKMHLASGWFLRPNLEETQIAFDRVKQPVDT
jgi:hypothetical protein